jgi:DNA-binding transcriptional MerR regulator
MLIISSVINPTGSGGPSEQGGSVPDSPDKQHQPALIEIPAKNFYKIGEVALITGLEPYVLRYWETEFREIRPVRARSKQRLYRREDVETILRIKQLLHEEKFTIAGAKRKLIEEKKGVVMAPDEAGPPSEVLAEIRAELVKIRDLLS